MLDVTGVTRALRPLGDEEAEAVANAVVTVEAKLAQAKDAPPPVLTAAILWETAALDAAAAEALAARRDAGRRRSNRGRGCERTSPRRRGRVTATAANAAGRARSCRRSRRWGRRSSDADTWGQSGPPP